MSPSNEAAQDTLQSNVASMPSAEITAHNATIAGLNDPLMTARLKFEEGS
jgi:hypothetical protein